VKPGMPSVPVAVRLNVTAAAVAGIFLLPNSSVHTSTSQYQPLGSLSLSRVSMLRYGVICDLAGVDAMLGRSSREDLLGGCAIVAALDRSVSLDLRQGADF
jgi:hypothetical protein